MTLKGPLKTRSGRAASVSSRGAERGRRGVTKPDRRAPPPGLGRLRQRAPRPRPRGSCRPGRRDSHRHVTSPPPLPATQICPRNPRPAGRAEGHVAAAPALPRPGACALGVLLLWVHVPLAIMTVSGDHLRKCKIFPLVQEGKTFGFVSARIHLHPTPSRPE